MTLPPARDFARHALIVAGFNTAIGLALAFARGDHWVQQMIYAQAIGLSIWACTDFGRLLFKRDPQTNWPSGWRHVLLQAVAVIVGYVVGTWLGDLFCGCSTFELWAGSQRTFAGYLVVSIGASAAVSFFFFSRSRDELRLRQLADAQRDTAAARLKLLESQLEPHMLFNTLANLRVLIGMDPPRAQQMLDQLIGYLRATLSASRATMHPLSAEFARVADYLELMKVRMGARLEPRLALPPELADAAVPPLILQPLVENAIKHGLEPHVEGGQLTVSAAREGEQLALCVQDTGAGLSAQASTAGTGFGLQQVRERLATLYGQSASLTLATRPEGGTITTVRLPLQAPTKT